MEKRISTVDFQKKCDQGEKIVLATAYDYSMALAVDAAGWTPFWWATVFP